MAYSLGGRLALHLNWNLFEKVILVATHPGLFENTEVRLKDDREKAKKMMTEPWPQWIESWNQQPVFQKDRVRPPRLLNRRQIKVWAEILTSFSLGSQKTFDEKIKENQNKLYWLRGEEDLKFSQLDSRIQSLIGGDRWIPIANSGHGVLFDNPLGLSRELKKRGIG